MERPLKIPKDILPYLEYVEAKLRQYEESPLITAYISTLTFVNRLCKQIYTQEVDIFDPENKPIFEMAHKFQTELLPYLETLDEIRKKMTPEQQKELAEKIKIDNLRPAEKIALAAKDNAL